MKYLWVVVVLTVLLQTASNQEDLTDEEMADSPEEGPTSPPFQPPERPTGDVYFAESFTDEDGVWKRWIPSEATKDGADSDVAKYNGKTLDLYLIVIPSLLCIIAIPYRQVGAGFSLH